MHSDSILHGLQLLEDSLRMLDAIDAQVQPQSRGGARRLRAALTAFPHRRFDEASRSSVVEAVFREVQLFQEMSPVAGS